MWGDQLLEAELCPPADGEIFSFFKEGGQHVYYAYLGFRFVDPEKVASIVRDQLHFDEGETEETLLEALKDPELYVCMGLWEIFDGDLYTTYDLGWGDGDSSSTCLREWSWPKSP